MMRTKSKTRKRKVSPARIKKLGARRKAPYRARFDVTAQMPNYLLEPHPEFGV